VFITGGTFTRDIDDFLTSTPKPPPDEAVQPRRDPRRHRPGRPAGSVTRARPLASLRAPRVEGAALTYVGNTSRRVGRSEGDGSAVGRDSDPGACEGTAPIAGDPRRGHRAVHDRAVRAGTCDTPRVAVARLVRPSSRRLHSPDISCSRSAASAPRSRSDSRSSSMVLIALRSMRMPSAGTGHAEDARGADPILAACPRHPDGRRRVPRSRSTTRPMSPQATIRMPRSRRG